MRILAISGSLRRDSHNTALLLAAAEHLPPGEPFPETQSLGNPDSKFEDEP
jgi:NAD(P)H-dependent FMN reductase